MIDSLIKPDWKSRLIHFQTIFVGYSGGLDSTVLLYNLVQDPALSGRVSAIHVHHGISQHADAWLYHCEQFCRELSVPLIVSKVSFDKSANIEERAREARYEVFSSYLSESDCLLLAHHSDDQAETVLLHLFRGTGIDGLAGMSETRSLAKGLLHRPFLHLTRSHLEAYAKEYQLRFIDDDSNLNESFSRNYLRHQVMPLLQRTWPGVVAHLAQNARHCQDVKTNLEVLAAIDCKELKSTTLSLTTLKNLEKNRLTNVLRAWLKHNKIRLPSTRQMNQLINDVIFARADTMPSLSFGKVVIRRYQQTLYLFENNATTRPAAFEWRMFPGCFLSDDIHLTAKPSTKGVKVAPDSKIEVRFRLGGELFRWHGQTKSLKKLWQQWGVPPWLREFIPLLYIDDSLASVIGFAVSDDHYAIDGEHVYQIRDENATTLN